MLVRYVLLLVLVLLVAHAVRRLVGGALQGMSGGPGSARRGGAPLRGVQMVRDPICGTYVVPERAVTLLEGGERIAFCSTACRDRYRPPSSSRPSSASHEPRGRTA